MKYVVGTDHEQVLGLLDGLRDGAMYYIVQPGTDVTIDSEKGTFTFEHFTFDDGQFMITGEMTYRCWGHVIVFVMKQVTTGQERRIIAEQFIAFGKENSIEGLEDENWIRAFARELD